MKAIILAGGLGTRLRPLTDNTPKPLLPIHGRPTIEHAILNFKKHGILDIVLSIGYKADIIRNYFKDGQDLGVNISYEIEAEPLGTGGAAKQAARNLDETFIVINGDNLADFDWTKAIEAHKKNNAQITLQLYPVEDVTKFGIVRLDGEKVLEFVEKPAVDKAPSNLSNAGGYIIEKAAFEILPDGFCMIERDCFEKLASKGVIYGFNHLGQWFPTDNIEKYNFANENFKPL